MSNVMTISKRTASGLEEVLRTLLLDAESKVPADRLRIVGAIAEGAVIESGSNANGGWVRFANGLQMCWGYYSQPANASTSTSLTFPAQFISVNISMAAGIEPDIVSGALPGATPICNVAPRSTVTFVLKIIYITIDGKITAPPVPFLSRWIAIGRWK